MTASIFLHGADRVFGAEIAAALAADGRAIAPAGAAPTGAPAGHALVINRPVNRTDLRFDDIDDDAFAAAIDETVMAVLDIVQPALPALGAGGRIVIVASRAHLGGWGGAHLMAAGAALVGFCRTLALELADDRVTVNIVAPDFADVYADDAEGRARVAEAVAWLVSPQAAGVSGEVTLLNAGRSLQMRESRKR